MVGTAQQRRRCRGVRLGENIQHGAGRRLLLHQSGLTRIDGERVPAAEVVMGTFAHQTSRAEDPQSHIHGALMKMCVRPDGKIGMLDNILLKKYGGAIAAYHRALVAPHNTLRCANQTGEESP